MEKQASVERADGFVSPVRNKNRTTEMSPLFWRSGRLLRVVGGAAVLLLIGAVLLLGIGLLLDAKQPPLLLVYGSIALGALGVLAGWLCIALMFIRCRCRCSLCRDPVQFHWLIGLYPLSQSCVHCGAKIARPPTYAD